MLLFVCIGGIHCYDVFRMNNNAHAAVRSVSRMELKMHYEAMKTDCLNVLVLLNFNESSYE